MESIGESISKFKERIDKIAFVGVHGLTRRKFDRILGRNLARTTLLWAYFQDAERAKEWLV